MLISMQKVCFCQPNEQFKKYLCFIFTTRINASGVSVDCCGHGRPIVRMFIEALKGHHYFDCLPACGKVLAAAVQQKVFSLVSRLIEVLVPPGVPPAALSPAACNQFLDLMTVPARGPSDKPQNINNPSAIFGRP
jgi:hypothetical protein